MKLERKTTLVLILIILMAVYLVYPKETRNTHQTFTSEVDENLNNTYYQNLGNNRYLVDNWTLKYYHTNWSEPRPCTDYGPFSVVFECPEENMVIEVTGIQTYPESTEFTFPLVLYPGNAYSYDATALWTENVTCSETTQIHLVDSRWYTLSLTGDVTKNGHRFSLRGWSGDRYDTVLLYVSFQLKTSDGTVTLFKVDNSVWDHS